MAIIGYARVSTQDQNLDAQIEQLKAAGCTRIYQEKVSGVKQDRPELAKLIDFAREGDVVVVAKLDRIGRSTSHVLGLVDDFAKRGIGFKALNSPIDTTAATGKLMLTILAAVAEFERNMLLERQAEGIAIAKREGKYTGRQPTAQRQAEKVLEMLGAGKSKLEVAKELGIGKSSVYRIAEQAGKEA